jgi:hypothetical protein
MNDRRHAIHLDEKYAQPALIDLAAGAAAHEPRFDGTLTRVRTRGPAAAARMPSPPRSGIAPGPRPPSHVHAGA